MLIPNSSISLMTVISGTPSSGRAPALKPLKFLFPPQLHPQYSKNSTCSIPSVTNLGLSSKEAISCNQRDSQSLAFLLRFCSYHNSTSYTTRPAVVVGAQQRSSSSSFSHTLENFQAMRDWAEVGGVTLLRMRSGCPRPVP